MPDTEADIAGGDYLRRFEYRVRSMLPPVTFDNYADFIDGVSAGVPMVQVRRVIFLHDEELRRTHIPNQEFVLEFEARRLNGRRLKYDHRVGWFHGVSQREGNDRFRWASQLEMLSGNAQLVVTDFGEQMPANVQVVFNDAITFIA